MSSNLVLHERECFVTPNVATSSSHYWEKKADIFGVYFSFCKFQSSTFQTNKPFLKTWSMNLWGPYVVAMELMKLYWTVTALLQLSISS